MEERYDIETLSIESIKYGAFSLQNPAENEYQKLVPDPFLILVNNPKKAKACKKLV